MRRKIWLSTVPRIGTIMDVSLTPELEQMVQTKVRTGRYNSASEVVREELQLMVKRDQVKADLREKIAEGIAELRQGKGIDGEAFMDELEAEIDAEIAA